jgi:hypothetical protein
VAEDEDMRGRAEGDCAVGVVFDQHPNGHVVAVALLRCLHVCDQGGRSLQANTCALFVARGSTLALGFPGMLVHRTSNGLAVQLVPKCLQGSLTAC